MELTQYRSSVVKPIEGDSPVGVRLIDDALYEYVEEQMMKVGSLAHGSVQWQQVEHSAITLLSEKSKDIKLLVYLLQCLHHDINPTRLIVSFGVMRDFIEHYWEDSFPAQGDRGKLPRRKFFSQICQRFSTAVKKFDFACLNTSLVDELKEAVSEWQQTLTAKQLSSDLSESIVITINSELIKRAERLASVPVSSTPPTIPSASIASEPPTFTVDNSSDKATKETLLKVASFLSEQEMGSVLAIRVRRYAMWSSIDSLPDHNAQGHSVLRSMQSDRVKEYREQMDSPNLALWRKVEQSLTVAPFWFEGQMLSAQIAEALERTDWSNAIKEETQTFLERFPYLVEMAFKGGKPFVPNEVRNWIYESKTECSPYGQSNGAWQELRQEAFDLAKEGGISVAMSMVNDGLVVASEPRDRFYWRLIGADLLKHHQLDGIALSQYQTLEQEILQTSVVQWEPSLVQQLQQNTASE
ncbi:type VI secretion system protein TssA [Vibrio aquaticus]|uniref:Type VI secretion system protein TssA n=1 Tax=Vibrio aquaticus TaxID=2496559 RepID=A0A432CWV4_9VIBR|nr:type VI secretion system protein TssA [Vibrio aquaticus]RTZ16419.1 type VI secretion system protein TssA [Vibrio aquaticus]